jgi:hypothetical protein
MRAIRSASAARAASYTLYAWFVAATEASADLVAEFAALVAVLAARLASPA